MVVSVSSLTGNGLKDWLLQRISAVYLLVYLFFLAVFFCMHPQLDYATWTSMFQCNIVKIASMIAIIMLLLHAWIGIWTVSTDYLSHTYLRISVQTAVFLFLLAQLLWGLIMLWGQ